MFSTVHEAFAFFESFTNLEKLPPPSVRVYKLERMRRLMDYFDHPEGSLSLIHIAGSKGKGSVGIFIASIIEKLQFKTGLYTSPHVLSYMERITRAGEPFPEKTIIKEAQNIKEAIPDLAKEGFSGEEGPTTFELLTLLAFLVFRSQGCQWAVIETGIGGRLDATNVITPRLSVITPIELEHTDILGTTIPEITREKGGIIKPGVPVVVSKQKEEAISVLEQIARERGSSLYRMDEATAWINTTFLGGRTRVNWQFHGDSPETAHLRLNGDFQGDNAVTAALAVKTLLRGGDFPGYLGTSMGGEGWKIPIARGLESAFLSGRMEVVDRKVPFILDGAHTLSSVTALIGSLEKMFPGDYILLFGSLVGKDFASMARLLSPKARAVIISQPGTFKKSNLNELFDFFSSLHNQVFLIPNTDEAIKKAEALAEGRTPVLVTGSFYLISEVKRRIAPNLSPGV